jgi:site-specific DNA-methyltransferase (cytosine-N4-specific)
MYLKNIDKQLVEKLGKLPVSYWDFLGEDTKDLTHGIHNYPAMMIYPISRNIIRIMKQFQPNIKTFMDPYTGSGTCLVEAILADMDTVYGTDLNPLARLISNVKTKHLHHKDIKKEVEKLEKNINKSYEHYKILLTDINGYILGKGLDVTAKATDKENWGFKAPEILKEFVTLCGLELEIPDFVNLGFWFLPHVVLELQIIKDCIIKVENEDVRNFFWVAFSEMTRLVSNRRNSEFKMYRMEAQKVLKFNPNPKKEFFDILERNVAKMKDFYDKCDEREKDAEVHIFDNDTRYLQDVPDNCVDLVVTSPPYGDSRTTVAYGEFSRVSLQWANLEDLSDKEIKGIDKSLMGGTKFKEYEFDLHSNTLKESLEKIKNYPQGDKNKNVERAGDVYSFYKDLQDCIGSITKKCKVNSYQFWVVGNRTVKEENLKTSEILVEMGEKFGLKHVYTMGRNIPNKVMPLANSPSNEAGKTVTTMCNEHIVVLRKER